MVTKVVVEEPSRMRLLPHDKHGRPVPWFVAWIDGKPEFRVVRKYGFQEAIERKLCWVCGIPFQRQEDRCFVIGPMCALNRISAEPPSHLDCATFSARMCPFLTTPNMTRRTNGLPEESGSPAGFMVERNPGVTLVWTTKYNSWKVVKDPQTGGSLVNIGAPLRTSWYCEGRLATRAEVVESIDTGIPVFYELDPSEEAKADIERRRQVAMELVPAA